MTQGDFPFPAVGLVHVQNRIEQRRPIEATEKLEIHVSAGELKPHPKGKTFALQTRSARGGEEVWVSESTNLRRGKGSESASDSGPVLRSRPRHRGGVEPAERSGPELRRRLGRPQPDPHVRADREGARLPAPDRPRHVDQGALRRSARAAAAWRVRGRGRFQAPDPPAVEGRVRLGRRRCGASASAFARLATASRTWRAPPRSSSTLLVPTRATQAPSRQPARRARRDACVLVCGRVADIDAVETEEWLEALDAVVENDGPRRAHDLVERVVERARLQGRRDRVRRADSLRQHDPRRGRAAAARRSRRWSGASAR